jgi:hypothetical protein
MTTVFGWHIWISNYLIRSSKGAGKSLDPSLRNFPVQANAAEIFRLACCLVTERGIRICAPVHDAILVEASLAEIEEAVRITQRSFVEASRAVLDGFELRSEAKIFTERFEEDRGRETWELVNRLILEQGTELRIGNGIRQQAKLSYQQPALEVL